MFTGLIQGLGTLERYAAEELRISCMSNVADLILSDLAIGDSVAVDGVCLTVVEILSQGFLATASPETLQRTTLGQQRENFFVNLETSLRVGSKLGGHFVTGHVDGLGYLQAAVETASSWEMAFKTSVPTIAGHIVRKGSITVNGISLTIADCNDIGDWFKVAVIPHTYTSTNLKDLQPGSPVNLESDILGKYVEKFLRFNLNHSKNLTATDKTEEMDAEPPVISPEGVTPAFLAEHGYL